MEDSSRRKGWMERYLFSGMVSITKNTKKNKNILMKL